MSTKIYEAYRIRGNVNFWKIAQRIRVKGEASVVETLKRFYLENLDLVVEDSDKYRSCLKVCQGDVYLAKLAVVHDVLFDLYKACYSRFGGGSFDLTIIVRFYRLGRTIYMIPSVNWLAPTSQCLSFLKDEQGLEEYAYWNNTDHPEHLTRRAWLKRGRMWDRVLKQGVLLEMRILDLFGNFHKLDPWWKLIEEHKKQSEDTKGNENV
jgi:hypothetical protein